MNTFTQEIKKTGEVFSKNKYEKIAFEVGFASGVDFAQRWIQIEEEKPVPYEKGNDWDGLRTDPVLVKTGDDLEFIARAYEFVEDYEKFFLFFDNHDFEITNVIEWRPIEYK